MVWVLVVLVAYLAALVLIAWVSLHPPRVPVFFSPGSLGAPQVEMEFESLDGLRLKGWWIPADEPTGVAVLSHGYIMNRSELATVAYTLWRQGVSCLLIDFRAHGRSEAATCTMGYSERQDVIAAARWARAKAPDLPLVLIGSSMGSAASAFALAEDPTIADALVLDSSYSRLASASIGWWRFLGGKVLAFFLAPVALVAIPFVRLNPFLVDVGKALEEIDKPVLILHGTADKLATPKEAKRNFARCKGACEIVWLEGCDHAEGRWIHPGLYGQSLERFLRASSIVR